MNDRRRELQIGLGTMIGILFAAWAVPGLDAQSDGRSAATVGYPRR